MIDSRGRQCGVSERPGLDCAPVSERYDASTAMINDVGGIVSHGTYPQGRPLGWEDSHRRLEPSKPWCGKAKSIGF